LININEKISNTLEISRKSVNAVVSLLDEGNTIPFIARYRKEKTNGLDDVQITSIQKNLDYLRKLENRKDEVIQTIDKQGKLSEELKDKIMNCVKLQDVEDLYLPYKKKRKTKATKAIEKGLEPLANLIMGKTDPEENAGEFIDEEKGVNSVEEALSGAMDIVTDRISTEPETRGYIRQQVIKEGKFIIKGKELEKESEFKMYEDYEEYVNSIKPHRILAINRGEKNKKLSVKIEFPDYLLNEMYSYWIDEENKNDYLLKSIDEAYKKHIKPSIEREVRSMLTEKAEEQAIYVFSENLKKLLMQRPLRNKVIMAIDPGIRTGSKLVVLDTKGDLITNDLIYQEKKQASVKKLADLCRNHNIDVIAIGNGTASREVEALVVDMLSDEKLSCKYALVSEAGASVYSASEVAREEFPDLDVTVRGAISIGRRILDPLSELVKIDPKSIGVGQYQYDVNQKTLQEELKRVVEFCVNSVGVNLNTASFSLLRYVSGIGDNVAKKIAEHRNKNGIFKTRKELLKVSGFGPKTFEQSAGFLKVPESKNFFDNTWVHPENYKEAEVIYEEINKNGSNIDTKSLASRLDIGDMTVNDIVEAIKKPNLDPRDDLPMPLLRSDILDFKDIKIGMRLQGTVRNVVDFGAFIDIGLKNDALCHISELSNEYVKNPYDVIQVGDIVSVTVIDIDEDRKRVSLSIKE
jgi:protein Tex